MQTFREMEEFLARETSRHGVGDSYPFGQPKRVRQSWLINNYDYTVNVLTKMRGVGRKSLNEFFFALDLETETRLIRR